LSIADAGASRACEQAHIAITAEGASFTNKAGALFPVGVNYFHLSQSPYSSINTFDENEFDRESVDAAFAAIHGSGFNYVRTYLSGYDADRGFGGHPNQISQAYLRNIAEALRLADKHHLYVVLTGRFKDRGIPSNYLHQSGATPNVSGFNRLLLLPSYSAGLANFYHDLLRGLQDIDSNLLSCVLYFDLYSELQYDINGAPFSAESGTFMFGEKNYRLDDRSDRQALIDVASDQWLRRIISRLKATAPGLPVTASTFPNAVFGRKGFDGAWSTPRSRQKPVDPYPIDPRVLTNAGADLLDIHVYVHPLRGPVPAMHDDLQRVLGSNGFSANTHLRIPLIIGEVGAMKDIYPSPADAAPELAETVSTLCRFGISGWAFWMWDGPGTTWSLADGQGALLRVLSPRTAQNADVQCRNHVAR
jgi:hypothetical protein